MPNTEHEESRLRFLTSSSIKPMIILNVGFALLYLYAISFLFEIGNPILFGMLIVGEIFHVWQVLTFLYTIWDTTPPRRAPLLAKPLSVDIFITVCGEPTELVAETVRAAKNMRHRSPFHVYVLNDGYVAKKDNWQEIEEMADREGVHCITRTVPGGAKAGNINHALGLTRSPLVAIFDADHVPHEDFLEKTVGYFSDRSMGFVQIPQYYKNYQLNEVTRSSWEQQELFFGAICMGKNHTNAGTMCGTNMVLSREALNAVAGIAADSIAEDFLTGMKIHEKGYGSIYVPEVLSEGLATEDLLTYTKQQFRWARGALDVIFRYNPIFQKGLTWGQRIQYLSSASFYLSGVIVVLDMLLPLVFFYTGLVPVRISGMLLATIFLPYLFLTLFVIQRSSNFVLTYRSMAFSTGAFHIHLQALWAAVTRKQSAFVVSSKHQLKGNFIRLATPHLVYIALIAIGLVVGYLREGISASFINNFAWSALNVGLLAPYILASLPVSEVRKAMPKISVAEMSSSMGATLQMQTPVQ